MTLFRVGDTVTINVGSEARSWGYNPAPEGESAKILSFGEIYYGRRNNCCMKPGVHINDSWADVLFNGEIQQISCCYLKLDPAIEKARLCLINEYAGLTAEEIDEKNQQERNKNFLRDLPETEFYEGDIVHNDYDPDFSIIQSISYSDIGQKDIYGGDLPIYSLGRFGGGGYMTLDTSRLKLKERGKIWKYFHNEPLNFNSLKEEVDFFVDLGRYREVRNPENKIFSWRSHERKEAIQNGLGDFILGNSVIKLNDRDLGVRAAVEFLKSEGLTPNFVIITPQLNLPKILEFEGAA